MAKDVYHVSLKLLLRNERGEILLLKAVDGGSYAGFYDLPGGRIDANEFYTDFADIIAREIKEEIGEIRYTLERKPVAVGRHRIPAELTTAGKEIHVLYLFFVAEYQGGEIHISDEHAGFEWVDVSKVKLEDYFKSGILEGVKMFLMR
jgi:8-oxo-dGTP diphosphatase